MKIAGKKDKTFFFWQPYKKRDQITFAGLGRVLTMSHYHRLEAVALLHLLYLVETFFSQIILLSAKLYAY